MTTPSSTSCRQWVPMCPDVSLQPVDIRCFSTSWARSALHGIQHLGGGHHEFAYQIANRHQLERLLDSKTRTLSQFDPCTNHAFEIALVDDHLPQRKQRIRVICFMMPVVLVLGWFRYLLLQHCTRPTFSMSISMPMSPPAIIQHPFLQIAGCKANASSKPLHKPLHTKH